MKKMVFIAGLPVFMIIAVCAFGGEGPWTSIKTLIDKADSPKQREVGLSMLRENREKVGNSLIAMVHVRTDGFTAGSRSGVAARCLGVMRYEGATEVLVEALSETGSLDELYTNPAIEALERIGLPAVPHLIDKLAKPDSLAQKNNAVKILKTVCGDRYARILIEEAKDRIADSEKKNGLDSVLAQHFAKQ